jgi:phosphonate transport system permease protein
MRLYAKPLLTVLALSLLLGGSAAWLARDWTGSFDIAALGGRLVEFFPPDLSHDHLSAVAKATWETLVLSVWGSALALIGAAVLALPASGTYGLAAKLPARAILNFLRAVPDLLWAAIAVLAAGIGPLAGVIALALHTTGVLGRLYAETLENAPREPAQALQLAGSTRLLAFLYGTLPVVAGQWIAYALYRWEVNIRIAAVMGFVGAGGLGQMLYMTLSLFQMKQAATVILATLLLAWLAESFSARLRRGLQPA